MKGMDKKEKGKEFSDFSIQCNTAINEYTNSTGHMQDNVKDLESNKKKSKNDIWLQQPAEAPGKIFIYRLQEEINKSQNSALLRKM